MTEIEQGQSVTAVALDCGYNSVSAFISAFKKHFGSTPGAIAKRRHDTEERERERERPMKWPAPAPSASPFRPIIENARRMIPSSGIFQLWQCL